MAAVQQYVSKKPVGFRPVPGGLDGTVSQLFFANSEVALVRPNKLQAKVRGDAPPFDFYYDGSIPRRIGRRGPLPDTDRCMTLLSLRNVERIRP
jgi:hypothetical protein